MLQAQREDFGVCAPMSSKERKPTLLFTDLTLTCLTHHPARIPDLFIQIVLQLTTAVLLGILTAQPWAQSTVGGISVLVILLILQLIGAFWSFYNTGNDRIDCFEKGVVYLIEAVALSLLLASSILGMKEEGEDVDLERLVLSLQLASLSATVLLAGIFFPMTITLCNVPCMSQTLLELLAQTSC